MEDLRRVIEGLRDDLVAWRRDFHRHPEVAGEEHRTQATVRRLLEEMGLPVAACAGTGLRVVVEGRPGGGCVALRADMDALPITEEGDRDYVSQNPGAAHSCGHDGHMAIVLGVAKALAARRDRFPGRVVLLFQPSEEKFPGGANPMIQEGALEGVDAVFGLHLWQGLPTGTVGLVGGPMMAQPDVFEIVITGRGGHGSMPHQTVDPILAAAHVVTAVQSIVSRNQDPLHPLVVSFGSIHGGTVDNVIPGEVVLTGTVRTFDDAVQAMAERRLMEIVLQVSAALGAAAEVKYRRGYPPLVNDPAMADFVREVAERALGAGAIRPVEPVMGGEDFAYFLREVPGAFLFFGIGDRTLHPHHHPGFDLDEEALVPATHLMASLALEFLAGKAPSA
jgi:amidohydrolase